MRLDTMFETQPPDFSKLLTSAAGVNEPQHWHGCVLYRLAPISWMCLPKSQRPLILDPFYELHTPAPPTQQSRLDWA